MNKNRFTYSFISAVLLCGVAVVVASCDNRGENDGIASNGREENGIYMSTSVRQLTKADFGSEEENVLIDDIVTIQSSGSDIVLFGGVRGESDGAATAVTILDATPLEWNATDECWEYEPLQYWLYGASYNFAAVWPSGALTSGTFDASTGTLSCDMDYVSVPSTERPQQEVLVAVASREPSVDGTEEVELPLEHALAAVRFRVRNISEEVLSIVNEHLLGIKNRGTGLVAEPDGTITWEATYADGYDATTPQYQSSSGVSYETRSGTKEYEVERIYQYRRNSYQSYTTYTTVESTETIPWSYEVGVLDGGECIDLPISTTYTTLFNTDNFYLSATEDYQLSNNGWILFPAQQVTEDMAVSFDSTIKQSAGEEETTSVVVTEYYRKNNNSNNNDLTRYTHDTSADVRGDIVLYTTEDGYAVDVTYKIALAAATGITEWEPGKLYSYDITIATDAIIFDVQMLDWDEEVIEL